MLFRSEAVLAKDAAWAAPVLWRSELRSVLTLYMRREALALELAIEMFAQAELIIGVREHVVPARSVLELVDITSCSAYDCEYAALAAALGVPLVTTDRQLLAGFPGLAVSPARFLGR